MTDQAFLRRGRSRARVAIGLGANVGRPARQLAGALRRLGRLLEEEPQSSRVYKTLPEDVREEPPYLNLCCVGRTTYRPRPLLDRLHQIEQECGRPPPPRSGPRVLDLDLLLYDVIHLKAAGLKIPHPRMTRRNFVMLPLAEVASTWPIPGTDRSVGEIAEEMDDSGIVCIRSLDRFLETEGACPELDGQAESCDPD